MLTFMCK